MCGLYNYEVNCILVIVHLIFISVRSHLILWAKYNFQHNGVLKAPLRSITRGKSC